MTDAEILRRCAAGARIIKTLWTGPSGVGHVDYCLTGGQRIGERQAEALLAGGAFVPCDDGLPGLKNAQSWRLKDKER